MWNYRFVAEGDAILADAEAAARTPETKLRVAVCRLPIWKLKLDRAFGEIGKVVDLPIEWSFRTAPDAKGRKEGWQQSPKISRALNRVQAGETNFYAVWDHWLLATLCSWQRQSEGNYAIELAADARDSPPAPRTRLEGI